MTPIFINNSDETFTPTRSGALATIIFELCRVAQTQGVEPLVITRDADAAPFPWTRTIRLPYPNVSGGHLGERLARAERKFSGWRHLRQGAWAARVAQTLRAQNVENGPLVLINDPELAVFLRRKFPKTFLLHWFENQHECKPKFRAAYKDSVNVTAAVSDFTGRWIAPYYNLTPVPTLPNGVDYEHFSPADFVPEGPPVIGFVGRTGIEKAPDLLLKAAVQLSEVTKNFRLQIVGSNHWGALTMDAYQCELQALVDELESKKIAVRRPGHVGRRDLPEQLRQAHIHVTPSRWDEPFGMVTLEGMATGLATVASATGGTPEVVGDAGRLFARDNISELAGHLQELVTHAALRTELGQAARARARAFGWENSWARLTQLLKT